MIKLSLTIVGAFIAMKLTAGETPHRQIESLVNEGKFEEARKVETSSKVPAYLGIKRIEASEKCRPTLNDCNLDNLESQKVRSCLTSLEQSCERKYITQKYQQDFKQVWNKLKTFSNNDHTPAQVKGMCDSDLKWGYVRETDSKLFRKAFTMNVDYKSLHGQFETKDKCEEARLLEPKGVQTSNTCHVRYLGEEKTITVYQAWAMAGTAKKVLNFKEKSTCVQAVNNGFTYYPQGAKETTYAAKDGTSPNRFIKDCTEEKLIVCEQFKQGESLTDDLL